MATKSAVAKIREQGRKKKQKLSASIIKKTTTAKVKQAKQQGKTQLKSLKKQHR